ncbi:DUF4376 domain-containing protein [Pasteurella multocida]|uniref:DUF4376 domain-containing protein n=1 Tax=Pasteurella multocida TaxID=747 RepID=UPI0023007330|nr:DUF4376 domain-containing protein [Pasteurella multocida]MDA5607083.1 DUF4376 domain-containing protein [Pasteurella multocida subsp. multocida]MDA5614654.1 DUF4376 domain-containing protein [Pasteurella multocida]MDA5624623.1 DUF4376 domain-containing protein [Pasteurella multocida]
MTIYYKNGGFYLEPQESAVKISEELHRTLIEGQSEGKQIVTGLDGLPMLAEPQPSQYHEWNGEGWELSAEKQAVLLAEQRKKVRSKINEFRDRKINGGVYVEAVNKWIDTDATAERNLLSVKATFDLYGDAVGEIDWTCADNSILTINKDTLLVIWQAVMTAKTGNHANALRHKAAVEQSDVPLSYDYSDGWTQCYHDYIKEQGNE